MMTRFIFCIASVWAVTMAHGEPITMQRINTLPVTEQGAWKIFLTRSQTNAQADLAVVQTEVATHKMTNALQAPSGADFRLPAAPGDAWYGQAEAKQLADIVLSYQTPSGGWSKHTGYSKGPRQPGMQWTSQNEPGRKTHYVATFDNRATTEEMYFLAQVWYATKREDCKAGFINGLNFIFAAQFPNGGWPQVYPLEGGYHDDITFNDDAMTRILELLYAIKSDEAYYVFIDDALRQKAAAAFDRGLECVLKSQLTVAEKKTAWCAQYDPITLQPAAARKMEPAALSGLESAQLLKFLMTITNPAPELVASIESGLAWLDAVKIIGLTKTRRDGRTTFELSSTSTEIYWARFYDLKSGKPIFPGRDGVLYDSFNTMAAQNRLGYDYLSGLPGSIVSNGQKKWRKMLASQTGKK